MKNRKKYRIDMRNNTIKIKQRQHELKILTEKNRTICTKVTVTLNRCITVQFYVGVQNVRHGLYEVTIEMENGLCKN